MKKTRKWMSGMVGGAAYAWLTLLASRGLIRGLGRLVGLAGQLAGLEDGATVQVEQILSQLTRSAVASPWLPALLIGAAAGALLGMIPGRWGKRIFLTLFGIILFAPLTLVAVWFTAVNSIQVGMLVRLLIGLISKMG